jgi:multidrug resistance protein, MATE family
MPFWRLGVPIALAWVMEGGVFTAAALLAGTISIAALAAHQIALQAAAVAFNIYIGFAQGAAIRTGQCYGQNDIVSVRRYTWVGLTLGAVFCLLAAAIFFLFPEYIVALFTLGAEGSMDTEVRELGVSLLFVAALFQIVDGGQVIMMTALRAVRMGMPPTVVTLIGYWVIGFPVAWWLMAPFGIVGVWTGLGLGLAFAFLSLTAMFVWKMGKLEAAITPNSRQGDESATSVVL